MGFSLGDMFLAVLLFTNAAAILNEQRFLNKCAYFLCQRGARRWA